LREHCAQTFNRESNSMKILHLIDSLNAGGAERMAVGYVNALAQRGVEAYLWSTREEGILKDTLSPKVHYHFLNRKGPIGLKVLLKASYLIRQEKIQIIHAHSTSWFFGTLLKWLNPSVRLVWHDHFGSRKESQKPSNRVLIFCSKYFDTSIAVNEDLLNWHKEYLKKKNSNYLPNFVVNDSINQNVNRSDRKSKVIIYVANLREPKNHGNLINAFALVHKNHPEWKLWLVGKVSNDNYSQSLTDLIDKNDVIGSIQILGERSDVFELLNNAEIGVLSSDMEGLPMTILEYALAGLPVVTTDVGYCAEVIGNHGKVIPPKNPEALVEALEFYINHPDKRAEDGVQLNKHVLAHYTQEAVIPEVLKIYRRLIAQ